MNTAYVHVEPRAHDAACRRGLRPDSPQYGLDRERCARCRALWRRLDEVAARRTARNA